MSAPANLTKLQAFLGFANYYHVYIPNMHELTAPLNALLKKDAKWIWTKKCQSAFEKIKKAITSDLSLTHFDPKLKVVVASDASDAGIGAVILRKYDDGTTKQIAHASRFFMAAVKNYRQIEKEGLKEGLKKFHKFLHG